MNKFDIFTDKDLMILKQEAIELQDGRWLKAINAEITRRNRDE